MPAGQAPMQMPATPAPQETANTMPDLSSSPHTQYLPTPTAPAASNPSPAVQAPMQMFAASAPQTTATPGSSSPPPPANNGQELMYTTTHAPCLANKKVPTYSPEPHPIPMTAGFSGMLKAKPALKNDTPQAKPVSTNPFSGLLMALIP